MVTLLLSAVGHWQCQANDLVAHFRWNLGLFCYRMWLSLYGSQQNPSSDYYHVPSFKEVTLKTWGMAIAYSDHKNLEVQF